MKYVAALFAFLLLAGCGGGGGSSQPSPYQGAWAGVSGIADGTGSTGGGLPTTITLSVNSKGTVTGSWSDSGGSGSLSGKVSNGGTLSLSMVAPGPPPLALSGSGVTNIASDGSWQGSLAITSGDLAGSSIVFTATKQ